MRSTRASIRTGDGLGAAARPHSQWSVLREETEKALPPPPRDLPSILRSALVKQRFPQAHLTLLRGRKAQ